MRLDFGKMERNVNDIKKTASKTLVDSQESKTELDTLTQRVAKRKRGEGPTGSAFTTASSAYGSGTSAEFKQKWGGVQTKATQATRNANLGGEKGNTIVVGDFFQWKKKAQLELWGEK